MTSCCLLWLADSSRGLAALELTETVVVAVEASVVGLSIMVQLKAMPFSDLEGAGEVGADNRVGGGDIEVNKPPLAFCITCGGGGEWASIVEGGLRLILLSKLLCCCEEAGDKGISSIFSRSWAIEVEFCLCTLVSVPLGLREVSCSIGISKVEDLFDIDKGKEDCREDWWC